MDSILQVNVPLRLGGKRMKKRRELDALIFNSKQKNSPKCKDSCSATGQKLQENLLSGSTDDPEEYISHTVSSLTRTFRKRKYNVHGICGPVLTCVSFLMILGLMYWLYFDLKQQITVYRQKLEEVYATNQKLPDIFQNWHETSTTLLKNQTLIMCKIRDLQKLIETLQSSLSVNKTSMHSNHQKYLTEKLMTNFIVKLNASPADIV